MKKSRIAKLALMGASITALAATLTTSTYAWYVSNKTASVVGGSGTTGSAGADGSIVLSWKNGDDANWVKELDMGYETGTTTLKDSNATIVRNQLSPVHPDNTGAFFEFANDGWNKGSSAVTNKMVVVDFYLKAGAAGTATVALTVASEVTSQTQTLYADSGTVDAGTPIKVDVLDALYVQQKQDSTISYMACSNGTKANTTTAGLGSAHAYYKTIAELTDKTLWAEAPITTSTSFGALTLAANTEYHMYYTFFLDGGDEQCFNACENQNFTFSIKYTYTKNNG